MYRKHTISSPATKPWEDVIYLGGGVLSMTVALFTTACAHEPFLVGLKPESPRIEKESRLDTLRPTFRWERFPRTQDRAELDSVGGRIAAVSYELRLWKVGKEFSGGFETGDWIGASYDYKYSWQHECRDTDPGELVYSRQGIVHPSHTLATSLEPDSRYLWSVRAHFTLDGRPRATEWSEQLPPHVAKMGFSVPVTLRASGSIHGCWHPATFHLIRTP